MQVLVQIGLVALGSALGGLARWGAGSVCRKLLGTAFPWETLLINLTGCLFIGWFTTWLRGHGLDENSWLKRENLHLLVAVGFTGSYTTFSTYEFESYELLKHGLSWAGMAYLVGSVVLGLVAVRLGMMLARM